MVEEKKYNGEVNGAHQVGTHSETTYMKTRESAQNLGTTLQAV